MTVGEIREGVTNADGTVDIGLEVPFRLRGQSKTGRRATVRIESVNPPVAEVVPRDKLDEYWGYAVELKSIDQVLSDEKFRLKVGTSRFGKPFTTERPRLEAAMRGGGDLKLIFGSPSRGLYDMVGRDLDRRVDFVINLFPEQKVETVRTEEAILVGLNLISILAI